MNRIRTVLLAAGLALTLIAPAALAGHHSSRFGFGDDDDFSWTIVAGDNTSMSGQLDPEKLDDLKDRFGSRFLYIRDKDQGWVVTNHEMIERAQRASERIGRYGREIGEMARASAKLALEARRPTRDIARLREERRELRREIERAERNGDATDDLEQELFQVNIAIQANEGIAQNWKLSSEERDDLTRRREAASAKLHEAVREIHQEMRDILQDARERHLAEPVD